MTPDRARELVAQITVSVDGVRDRLVELYDGRGWLALGYATWGELCEVEFGSVAVGRLLPREKRRELVQELAAGGMSTGAIGPALGISRDTARRDRLNSPALDKAGGAVVGLDGKTYDVAKLRESQRAAAEHAATLDAEQEVERGIRDTNVHVAEAVHLLAWQTPDTFIRGFFPRHHEFLAPGMALTRDRCLAARAFLDRLLDEDTLL